MLNAYLSRFDIWQVVLTLAPLVGAVFGSALAFQSTRHLGKIVIGYSLFCLGVGLAPYWLPAAGLVPVGPIRAVLIETKVMIIVGVLAVLASGGRAVQWTSSSR